MLRVTLLCADLSQNSLSRAYLLGEILARDAQVDVAGSTFGDGIWPPAIGGRFPYAAVPGALWPRYAGSAARLLGALRGADVVYAMKPLPTSFGLALLHRRRTGCPVVLDVEDDDLAFLPPLRLRRPRSVAAAVVYPNGRLWARLTTSLAGAADAVTVASTGLRARFGGVLVPHVKDTAWLRPRPERRAAARERLGLGGQRVVMFMGTPRPHKGVEDAAAAVARMRHDVRFAVVGADPHDPYTERLRAAYGARLHLHPPYAMHEIPDLLEAADVVIVPQRLQPETAVQLPAKLLDAMALAKPVVATAVADIPAILAEGRGHVVAPGDVAAMAAALDAVFDAPDEGAAMGRRARAWCVEHASYDSAHAVLAATITAAAGRRRR